MARAKAYLFRGVEIRWSCASALLHKDDGTPESQTLHFPGGLADYLAAMVAARPTITQHPFTGRIDNGGGKAEWEICWPLERSEEHTSELQSLMRKSYSVLCLKKTYICEHQIPLHLSTTRPNRNKFDVDSYTLVA